MEWYEIKLEGRKSVKFPEKVLPSNITAEKRSSYGSNNVNKLGGIIKKGEWGWLAKDATLQIVSLKYGHTVSTFEFAESNGYENCVIKCVDQVFPNETNAVYLAVCLKRINGNGGSFAAIYSVDHSTVVSCMEVQQRVSCCRFMESRVCTRSLLQNFNGCLALGSEEGVIVLIDLNMANILAMHEKRSQDEVFTPCHIIDYNKPLLEIHRNFKQCQQDGIHFGLQIEVMEDPCSVCCLLPIDLTLCLAVGMEDGRLILYDLPELQIFYVANAEKHSTQAPLVKMDFLEPPDDPRPCLYLWTLHEDEESLTAILHSLCYEKRVIDHDADDFCFLETFQSSYVRLKLPLERKSSLAINCQSITKSMTQGEDYANCLCAFTWYAENEHKNKLMIFDLNQWYKEEMPYSIDINRSTNYLAAYVVNGQSCALHSFINPATIAHFNSLQRFEEHFYPSSLSFDCLLLFRDSCISCSWEGVQNRFINILRSSNASIFLEPDNYFNEIVRTRLMPQFYEHNSKTSIAKNNKYEIILSLALEYNCFSLLRDCAKCWVDGSFMGNLSVTTGITLSTLTDWAWKRATDIKARCNDLSKGLFDFGGYPLDQREQKELSFISRQIKLLADLLSEVLILAKAHIPEKVYNNLEQRYKSLRMASDYQDILLWLLNIGLLPEASPYNPKLNANHELVPYPYKILKDLYASKRVFFGKISENIVSKKTGSCRLLYIDALIEHECKGNVLREYWLENNGDGVYPPTSIEAMLRVMLVPDMSYDSKCSIMLYFFLDLNMTINDEVYKNVVANFIKFPSVFKLSASLIKTVQAFWNLDHGHFLPAVDEFISPFNKNQNYPQWLIELLTETLLTQNASNLALRILEARPSLISPILKLQTLLANELIAEAFHFARSKHDDALLEQFFKCCLCNGKFGVIRDLALSEKEGQLVQSILKNSKMQNSENLHFVYLLQNSKYIEAVSYMDEISKSKGMRSNGGGAMNTPNLVMAAYNTTMTPVTQGLTDVYFRIKNKIRKKETDNKSPVPLSCQLIKQNANNLLGGIYHSSALSAHFATYYWGEMENADKSSEETNNLLSSNNAPFLRKAQVDTNFSDLEQGNTVSYPRTYKVIEKRTLAESDVQDTSDYEKVSMQENPKKRRKVMGDEIVQDLSHIMQMNKNRTRFSNTEDFLTQPKPMETENSTENFLTQPPSVKSRVPAAEEFVHTSVKSLVSSEIHSILKTNTPEPMERHSMRREVAAEDESKNIRFDLPSSESEEENEVVEQRASKEVPKTTVVKIHEQIVEKRQEPKKIVTRSVSVDSCASTSSSCSSSKTPSEENFYSPISSQNTSLAIDNSFNDTRNSVGAITNRSSIISEGPKARKPLERNSVERRDKSKSPSPKDLATRSNKTLSPTPRETELPTTSPKRTPLIRHVYSPTSSKKFLTLDNRNSGILNESATPPIFISSISSMKSTTSHIKEFVPQVSSSKLVETHTQFSSEKTEKTEVKISEHSTVVGSLTYVESNMESSREIDRTKIAEAPRTKFPAIEQLDTTLGMSSYDLPLLDSTAEPHIKSCYQKENEREVSAIDNIDLYGDLDANVQLESYDDCEVIYDNALGLDSQPSMERDTPSLLVPIEKDTKNDSEVIVLLSSDDEIEEDKKYTKLSSTSPSEDSVLSYPNEEDEGEEEADDEDLENSGTSPEYEYTDNDDDDDAENEPGEPDFGNEDEATSNEKPSEADSEVNLKRSKSQSDAKKLVDSEVSLVDICEDDAEEEKEDDDDDDDDDDNDGDDNGLNDDNKQDDVEDEHCLEEKNKIQEVNTTEEEKDHCDMEIDDTEEDTNNLSPDKLESLKSADNIQSEETLVPQVLCLSEDKLKSNSDSSINSSNAEETTSMVMEDTSSKQTVMKISPTAAQMGIDPSTEVELSTELKSSPKVKPSTVAEEPDEKPLTEVEPSTVEVLSTKEKPSIELEAARVEVPSTKIELSSNAEPLSKVYSTSTSPSDKKKITKTDPVAKIVQPAQEEIETIKSSTSDVKSSYSSDVQVVQSDVSIIEISSEKSVEYIATSQKNDTKHKDKEDKLKERLEKSIKGNVINVTSAISIEDNSSNNSIDIVEEKKEDQVTKAVKQIPPNNKDEPSDPFGKLNVRNIKPITSVINLVENSSDTSAASDRATKDDQRSKNIEKNEQKQTEIIVIDSKDSIVDNKELVKEDKNSKKQNIQNIFDSSTKPRGSRAGSVPASTKVVDTLTQNSRRTRRESIGEEVTLQLTPRTRRSLRASSMQPLSLKEKEAEESLTPKRTRRSFVKEKEVEVVIVKDSEESMVVDEAVALQSTPRTRRSMRASSLQPLSLKEKQAEVIVVKDSEEALTPSRPRRSLAKEKDVEVVIVKDSEEALTPSRPRRSLVKRGTSVPPTTADEKTREPIKRGTSQPPAGVGETKIVRLRRSSLLEAISESPNVQDSPSTRTRSRLRHNSNDSDLDSTLPANEQPPQAKRTRKNSTSSGIADQPASTPTKSSRRNSVTSSQPDTNSPKSLRPRSVVTVQEETASTTIKPRTPKRKTSTDESLNETIIIEASEDDIKSTEEAHDVTGVSSEGAAAKQKKTAPKNETHDTSAAYSMSRRLTRTQLAMLEKSAALAGVSINDLTDSPGTTQTQASPKHVARRRNSRSTATSQHESDDAESVVSHRSAKSTKSNSAATRRRITRSSAKDKDEADDEIISLNSSVGSEKPTKRRSNESKHSPGSSKLPVIPEDDTNENVESKKPKTRRAKH